ncbi:hypothetical protein HR45_19255 [Shewanella mangrovi]|uniref:Uncharacterized protein n=1 Tax=Shewanella mangrovi TaxID=1515746 RepID=A0A094LLE2_9GAMM|nr:hypothetical protein HR45_19255 [Shewanella mangrovi]
MLLLGCTSASVMRVIADLPLSVGILRSSIIRGKEHFSFNYDEAWLTSKFVHQIDPTLQLYTGEQHAEDDLNQ